MNPSSKETPNMNLPPPVGEQPVPTVSDSEKSGEAKKPEKRGAASSETAAAATAQAASDLPIIPISLPANPQQTTQSDDSSTTKPIRSKVLNDPDLIEKEWVDKAKKIVDHTHNDPHRQSEELTGVKADYMKQRYDKTIKLNK